jgi:Domain of unknown function (DUF1906)
VHLGFDRSRYPGDAVMRSLRRCTPLTFAAIYLAPAPSHPDRGWMRKVPMLREIGWGFLPVYVGQQSPSGPGSHVLTTDQAYRDAQDAAHLAAAADLDAGSVLYLDVEQGGNLAPDHLGYVSAWAGWLRRESGYRPGAYCSYRDTAAQLTEAVGALPTWVFRVRDSGPAVIDPATEVPPDPGASGFAPAVAWQYRMSLSGPINLRWRDVDGVVHALEQVNLDCARTPDPSC